MQDAYKWIKVLKTFGKQVLGWKKRYMLMIWNKTLEIEESVQKLKYKERIFAFSEIKFLVAQNRTFCQNGLTHTNKTMAFFSLDLSGN